jgi:hypothetical protein
MIKRSFGIALLCLYFAVLALAFDRKFPLIASPSIPGAKGDVRYGTDKNGNTTIKLSVEHLPDPGFLTPPKNAYVVWFQQPGRAPEMKGYLRVNKDLKGSLEVSTSLKDFDIRITAESDPSTQIPLGLEAFHTTVQVR